MLHQPNAELTPTGRPPFLEAHHVVENDNALGVRCPGSAV